MVSIFGMIGAVIGATVAVAAEIRIWVEKHRNDRQNGGVQGENGNDHRPYPRPVPIRPETLPGAWVRGMAIGAVMVFALAAVTAVAAMTKHGSVSSTTPLRETTEIVGMLCLWVTAFGLIMAVNERNRGVAEVGGFAVVTSLIAVFGMVIIG